MQRKRRDLPAAGAATPATGFAGCTGRADAGTDGGTDEDESTPTATETTGAGAVAGGRRSAGDAGPGP